MESISEAAAYTLRFVNQTNKSVFLTGKAGTGKTTLLKEIIATTHKNTVVVAPTGIAALNAGGVTIHSMFQLPFGGFVPDFSTPSFTENSKFESKSTLARHFKMSALKKQVIRNMELLIIDEVSMLRPDLLDAIDFMMQTVRKSKIPFGGVQVLFIGDLLQLPPVVKDDEWRTLRKYYKGKFFFHAEVIQSFPPLYIELSKIYRQSDSVFVAILNNLRNNQITNNDIQVLNQYVQSDFDFKNNKGYITLTTHNAKAESINSQSLNDLDGKSFNYFAQITDDFPDKIYPLDSCLQLKLGAQVMFIKNDASPEKNYFNGKMGIIDALSENEIIVYFPDEHRKIEVERYEWQNIRYKVNELTKEIEEDVLGTFVHYPIKLAWAITVHKSQGLTFDKAALDVSQVFLPGQAYVALSRLRSLNGLILLSPIKMNGISNDEEVMNYAINKADEAQLAKSLALETQNFVCQYIKQSFDWNLLAQEWRNHQFSFGSESSDNPNAVWAKANAQIIWGLIDNANKFSAQLNALFSKQTIDYNFILERFTAAYNYFFNPMDILFEALLFKLEAIKRTKKAKAYFEEISALEEIQLNAILKLMKAKMLLTAIVEGNLISKENLNSEEIKTYKTNKLNAVQKQFKAQNSNLLDDDIDDVRYVSKSKSEKKIPKKTTVEETFELWQNNLAIDEIAATRKLTKDTILSHLTKLIQSKKILISEVLPADKIEALSAIFKYYDQESISPLKEKYGDEFSWEELRMFKASLNLN